MDNKTRVIHRHKFYSFPCKKCAVVYGARHRESSGKAPKKSTVIQGKESRRKPLLQRIWKAHGSLWEKPRNISQKNSGRSLHSSPRLTNSDTEHISWKRNCASYSNVKAQMRQRKSWIVGSNGHSIKLQRKYSLSAHEVIEIYLENIFLYFPIQILFLYGFLNPPSHFFILSHRLQ